MGKAKDILDGWKNYFQGADAVTLDIAKERAKICSGCEAATYGAHAAILPDMQISEIQGHYCSKKKGGCGCPLSTAVRSSGYECPKGKWKKVALHKTETQN